MIRESKDRRGLPCDERAELRDGRTKGCELHGNYYVGPPEAPSGFVFRPTNPDCAAESKADISMKFILANEQYNGIQVVQNTQNYDGKLRTGLLLLH